MPKTNLISASCRLRGHRVRGPGVREPANEQPNHARDQVQRTIGFRKSGVRRKLIGTERYSLRISVAEKQSSLTGKHSYLHRPERLFKVCKIDHASGEQVGHANDAVRVSKHVYLLGGR